MHLGMYLFIVFAALAAFAMFKVFSFMKLKQTATFLTGAYAVMIGNLMNHWVELQSYWAAVWEVLPMHLLAFVIVMPLSIVFLSLDSARNKERLANAA